MDNELEQRANLHVACFSDDREWTENYIKTEELTSRCVTVEAGGRIASACYLAPFELSVSGSSVPALFVHSLGTLPEFRFRGMATKLIRKTFETFSDTAFIFLKPFKAEFYEKQGFVSLNYFNEDTIIGGSPFETRDYEDGDFEFCKSAYERYAENFDGCFKRSDGYLKWRFGDCDGKPQILLLRGKRVGYALFSSPDYISDFAMLPPYDLRTTEPFRGVKYCRIGSGEVFTMARVASAEKLLRLIPYRKNFDGAISFNLTDRILPQNDGYYTLEIENGKCKTLQKYEKKVEGVSDVSAEFLTSLALGTFSETDEKTAPELAGAFEKRNILFFDIF